MSQSHIKEILEALRGKTIVDSIRLSYKSPVLDSDIIRLNDFPSVSIEKGSECIDLLFQPDFLTYVQWPYFSAVEQTQKVTGRADSLEVYAHQLFEDQNQDFALRFNEKGITFQNRKNIEDTLFLDLQRYCEHNGINYEVK
jgi:hypothetical protein